MKQLVTLLVLVGLGFVAYKHHTEQVQLAAAKAAAEARRAKSKMHAVALSRVVEPLYSDLFSNLDQNMPSDLVPQLQITKERILDMKMHAEPEKQEVYNRTAVLFDAMIAFAEERTKTLEALMKTAKGKSSLDGPTTASTSTAFFAQTTLKRWEEQKRTEKVRLDQLLANLRTAEREWNKRVGKDAPIERYDLPPKVPVYVTVDESVATSNPLERAAYDKRAVRYPWREGYYNRYGTPTR